MHQWRPITVMALICAAVLASAYGLAGLTHHIIVAVDKWGDAAPTAQEKAQALNDATDVKAAAVKSVATVSSATTNALNEIAGAASASLKQYGAVAPVAQQAIQDTAANINRPCRGVAGPDACGTLAEANKTMVRAGDAIATTQLVERDSIPHVVDAMDALKGAAMGLNGDADSLNDILRDAAIKRGIANVASMTDSWAGVSVDFRKVADKTTADYLKPVPWYMKPIKRGGELLDIGAAAARHVP